MAGGVRGPANPSYSNTEYSQPWGGIDVSKPSSQIDPGSAVSLTGSIIRGGLTNSPTIAPPQSRVPVSIPNLGGGEVIMLMTNLAGVTVFITNSGVYTDLATTTTKPFTKIFTFPVGYNAEQCSFGSVIIGSSLYFSSNGHRGIYKLSGSTVTEISAQNGSQPFIGGAFVGTISQRLVLGNIIGGDGNQTGSVTSGTVTTGGTGYPASGQVTFIGGGGQNATGTFTASGGVVNAITITSGGSGYLTGGTLQIISTGTGFTGTFAISGFTTNSTDTLFPDYVAWSFANVFGSFDPNSVLLGGGFDQLTEARGLVTGIAVFEAVWFAAHNGGFTEITPNTAGTNIQPFTFNPLWSADQGVVCRYGSLAQYGAECRFLGFDQPYQLSPAGLTPFGDKIASLVQNLSLWALEGQLPLPPLGLYGSIVEIEGEKHYLIVFTSADLTFSAHPDQVLTFVYDCNMKTDSWTTWFYQGLYVSAPIYQSYDSQDLLGQYPFAVRDNWILMAVNVTDAWVSTGGKLGQVFIGQNLFTMAASTPYFTGTLDIVFRAETPTMAIPQTTSRLVVEYENIPSQTAIIPELSCSLFGQPKANSAGAQAPITNAFALNLPYYAKTSSIPQNAVLTQLGEPQGTALTAMATSVEIFTNAPVRLIRTSLKAETTQSQLQ